MAKKSKSKAQDWREERLERIRSLIFEADPDMIEERKWRKASNGMAGIPVWSHNGILCTGEVYKAAVKTTFPKGAALDDPDHLFNSSMEGNVRRAIDFFEGEAIDGPAFKNLIKAAAMANREAATKKARK